MIHFHTIFLNFTRVLRSDQWKARMPLSGRRQRTWLHVSWMCVCVCVCVFACLQICSRDTWKGTWKRWSLCSLVYKRGINVDSSNMLSESFRYTQLAGARKVEVWHALYKSAKSLSHHHYKEAWYHCRLKVQHLAFPEGHHAESSGWQKEAAEES